MQIGILNQLYLFLQIFLINDLWWPTTTLATYSDNREANQNNHEKKKALMVQKHDNILKSFILLRHIYENEEILFLLRNPTYKLLGKI